jgi:hypothetical protein
VAAFLDGLSHHLAGLEHKPIREMRDDIPLLYDALVTARSIDADRRSREPRPV